MHSLRTSVPVPTQPWETARARFLDGLSPNDAARFNSATLENVFYDTSVAQKKHAHDHKSWLRQERLSSLADAISEYGQAMDVYSNTYGLIICPIWGSIRVLLHIASEAGKFQENIVEMLAQIGDILPRFRIYQVLFKKEERLLVALTDVFLDVLNFCVLAKNFFTQAKKSLSKSTPALLNYKMGLRWPVPLSIILKGAWKPFRREFELYMEMFRKHCKRVEREADLAHKIESARNREVQKATQALQLRSAKLQKRHEILTALPVVDYASMHAKLSALRHPGTNIWFQSTSQYVLWYNSQASDCLCYYGIPGSGKSVLCSTIVDDLMSRSTDPSTLVFYYYCDFADSASLSPNYLVASIIKQILERMPLDRFSDSFDGPHSGSKMMPNFVACLEYLLDILKDFDKSYLIVDGLDQFATDDQSIVLEMIDTLLQDKSIVVKIFVTSRREEYLIKRSLKKYTAVYSSKETIGADVRLFVEERIKLISEKQNPLLEDDRLKRDVVAALLAGADEMFLWVKFQLFDIADAFTENSVRATINNLPKDVEETYSRIIQKVRSSSGGKNRFDMMLKVFRWIAGARRPLRIDELEEAVGLEREDLFLHAERTVTNGGERLIACCSNLVVYNENNSTITFAHHTVQQFLFSPGWNQVSGGICLSPQLVNEYIAEICVAYLSFSDFGTQMVKMSEVVSMGQTQAEDIVWNNVPLASSIRSLLSWSRGLRRAPQTTPASQVLLKLPTIHRPTDSLIRKYVMLDYIVTCWAFHAASLNEQSWSWATFKHVVKGHQLAFNFRPWFESDQQEKVSEVGAIINERLASGVNIFYDPFKLQWSTEHMLLYSWAVRYGISSLMALVEYDELKAYQIFVEQEQVDKGLESHWQGQQGASFELQTFVRLAAAKRPTQPSSMGFWSNALITYIAYDLNRNHHRDDRQLYRVFDIFKTEFSRWVNQRVALLDDSFQEAIILALKADDMNLFRCLVSYYIRDHEKLIVTLVAIVRDGHTRNGVVAEMLSLQSVQGECSSRNRWELLYTLNQCMPAILAWITEEANMISQASPSIQHVLLALILLNRCRPSRLTQVINVVRNTFPGACPIFEPLDWSHTAFGTADIHARLEHLQEMSLVVRGTHLNTIAVQLRIIASYNPLPPELIQSTIDTIKVCLRSSGQFFDAEAFEEDGIHGLLWATERGLAELFNTLVPYYQDLLHNRINTDLSMNIIRAAASSPEKGATFATLQWPQWPAFIICDVRKELTRPYSILSSCIPMHRRDEWLQLMGFS
ncbi:hypothetical protein BKA66DRAFT_551263 [Pyrenochaeta sp. MPI-SDFR-AT-0127]|nr:hypothetical protein BKA66DRAFT_551263 [Pyrenochaeta sp. MPI-SDFR-AT-0127]